MKICHVNLASGYSGGENQTLTLIKQQLEMGYELVVVANPKSPFVEEIKKLDCKLVLVSQFLFGHSKSITKGCQAIHVHEGKAVYWALIQSLISGCPYVITRRVDNPLKDKWLLKWAYKKAKHVVALSSAIAEEILKPLPGKKVEIIPSSPVSYPASQANVRELKARYQKKVVIIQAAKLYKHKGHDITIEAARMLESELPQVQFCLLGDGPEEAALKAQAEGIRNVAFVGKQSNMGDWFAFADLLIHPSYTEGLGSVILEAIKAGLPVVGTEAGGIPDIIQHEVNGLLVAPGNARQLADAITRIVKYQDLRANLMIHANKSLDKFDIKNTSLRYEALYKS